MLSAHAHSIETMNREVFSEKYTIIVNFYSNDNGSRNLSDRRM